MRWWTLLRMRLRSVLRWRQVEEEMEDELRFHLEHKIEEGIGAGLTPEESRRRALVALGGLDQTREQMRDARGIHWLTDFVDDSRYAWRSLRRVPGLTVLVVLTLSLGIGMTTAPSSMLDALIFRPYPVPKPSQVMTLVNKSYEQPFGNFSYREYLDLRSQAKSFQGVTANSAVAAVGFVKEPGTAPRVGGGMLVSGNYFRTLGVEPALGRGFRDDEDRTPGRDAVAVLGPDFWKNEYGSDPAVVGRTIRLNGRDFTIIGVAPESFPGMQIFLRPSIYLPLAMATVFSTDPRKNFFEDRDDRELVVRARLRPDVTIEQARSEMSLIARSLERQYPQFNRDRTFGVHTQFEMRTQGDDVNWKFAVIFSVLGVAVLLVACTNVAGLLLSRASNRTREIAVRLSLGAGRFRLIRLLLAESLMLALLGGLGGIAVGYMGISFLQRFQIPSDLPVTVPFRMDTRMLILAMALALVSAVACGLAPALQSTRTDLVTGLKSAAADGLGGRRGWGRQALVVAQVACSLMLLTASFLMARGFERSFLKGIGFPQDRLLMARFDPRLARYQPEQARQFYERLMEQARALPGVKYAALTQNPPLGLDNFENVEFVPGDFEMPRDRATFRTSVDRVEEGYFETFGIPILRGRAFRRSDTADAPDVAIVNEHFEQRYWPNSTALGKRIRLDGPQGRMVEIVGVAPTIKYFQTMERPRDFLYLPLAQHPQNRMVLMLRTADDPLRSTEAVREVVRKLDANMPVIEMRTYEDLYRYNTVDGPQVAIRLVGSMGVTSLLLVVAGLYGLMAFQVSRKTREIGIRLAIGATPGDVLRLVLGKGVRLVLAGSAIGLALGLGLERMMNAMLFDAGHLDWLVYALVAPAMLLVATLAAYFPARRAARIAPTQALRYE